MRTSASVAALAITVLLGTIVPNIAFASDFCDGFKVGYEAGRCYRRLVCVKLVGPVCPVPRIGERTFEDGYQRGFLRGVERSRQ